jgi:hypothetical protein
VKGWIRTRIKAKISEDLEAQNGSMEAIDARNRGAAAQKNEAIEGRRPVVEVLNHIGEDPNPDRNRSYVKSWTRFRISEKRDPDPY